MANLTEHERQIQALWVKIDEITGQLTAKEKQSSIDAAVEAALKIEKEKELIRKDKWLKLIWIPIVLLILSNILSWVFKFLSGS